MLLHDVLDQIFHINPILWQAGAVVVGTLWDLPLNIRANIKFPSDLAAVWSEMEYNVRTIRRNAATMNLLYMIAVFLGMVCLKLALSALKLNVPVVLHPFLNE